MMRQITKPKLIGVVGVLVITTLLLSVGGIFGTATATQQYGETPENNVSVVTLDAGQANAQIIKTPDQTIVYDTGTYFDDGIPVINYLKNNNITNISMVISHSDSDHTGGASHIINYIENSTNGSVNNVYVGGTTSTTATYQDFLTQVANNNITKTKVTEGDTIPTTHPNTSISVLNPPNDETPVDSRANDFSVVLRVDYEDVEWILSGDISKEYEIKVIRDTDLSTLNIDSLTIGHHGADTSTSTTWLQATDPGVVVIPAPNSSSFNHPEPAVLTRIAEDIPNETPETFYTGKHGTVIETSNGEQLSVSTQFDRTTNATDVKTAPQQLDSVSPTNLTETVTLDIVRTTTDTSPGPIVGTNPDSSSGITRGSVIVVSVLAVIVGMFLARRS